MDKHNDRSSNPSGKPHSNHSPGTDPSIWEGCSSPSSQGRFAKEQAYCLTSRDGIVTSVRSSPALPELCDVQARSEVEAVRADGDPATVLSLAVITPQEGSCSIRTSLAGLQPGAKSTGANAPSVEFDLSVNPEHSSAILWRILVAFSEGGSRGVFNYIQDSAGESTSPIGLSGWIKITEGLGEASQLTGYMIADNPDIRADLQFVMRGENSPGGSIRGAIAPAAGGMIATDRELYFEISSAKYILIHVSDLMELFKSCDGIKRHTDRWVEKLSKLLVESGVLLGGDGTQVVTYIRPARKGELTCIGEASFNWCDELPELGMNVSSNLAPHVANLDEEEFATLNRVDESEPHPEVPKLPLSKSAEDLLHVLDDVSCEELHRAQVDSGQLSSAYSDEYLLDLDGLGDERRSTLSVDPWSSATVTWATFYTPSVPVEDQVKLSIQLPNEDSDKDDFAHLVLEVIGPSFLGFSPVYRAVDRINALGLSQYSFNRTVCEQLFASLHRINCETLIPRSSKTAMFLKVLAAHDLHLQPNNLPAKVIAAWRKWGGRQ